MQKESDREAALTKRAGGTAVAGPRQRGKTNLTEKMDKMHMWEFALNLHYGKLSLLVKSKTKLSVTTGLLKQKPLVFVLPMQRRSFHAKKLLVLTQGPACTSPTNPRAQRANPLFAHHSLKHLAWCKRSTIKCSLPCRPKTASAPS